MKDSEDMGKYNAKALAGRLDAAAVQIRKDAEDLRELADFLCSDGQRVASGIARQMAAGLENVYGLGRQLEFSVDGETVVATGGGK